MKYTQDNLLQIFLKGSLTTDAQEAFNHLIKKNPEFSQKVINLRAQHMGDISDQIVIPIASCLDSKIEFIWVKNQPPKTARFFKVFIKGSIILGICFILISSVCVLWPKLLILLPQINLSTSSSLNTSTSKIQRALPVMMAPEKIKLKKIMPVSIRKKTLGKMVLAKKNVLPFPAAALSNTNAEFRLGDPVRLSFNIDKTQTVVVDVFSSNGFLIRNIYQGFWGAGSHFVDWDGKNNIGNTVIPGNYIIVVRAGNQKISGNVTIKPR